MEVDTNMGRLSIGTLALAALAASQWRTVATVVIAAALRGILTGTILSVARVAGETAPLLEEGVERSLRRTAQ
jgi:phosphate transport system permease protein